MSFLKSTAVAIGLCFLALAVPATAQISWNSSRLQPFTEQTNYMSRAGYLRWRYSLGHIELVRDLSFSPDGQLLASVDLGATLRIWDVKNQSLLRTLTPACYPIAFSPDGQTLMSSSERNAETVTLWDVATGREKRKIARDYGGDNQWFFWTRDGKTLALGRQLLKITDEKSTVIPTVALDNINHADFQVVSPDGTLLAQNFTADIAYLKDIRTGETRQKLESGVGYVRDAVFSDDGQQLVLVGDTAIELWNLKTATMTWTIATRNNYIRFSPSGNWLAGGGESNAVKIWNARTGEIKCSLPGARFPVSFAPDDKTVATGYFARSGEDFPEAGNFIFLWNLESGEREGSLPRDKNTIALR